MSDPARRDALVEVLLEFGDALLEQHEYEQAGSVSADALRVITGLIAEDPGERGPNLATALRQHGNALIELDAIDRAIEVYGHAIRLLGELANVDVRARPQLRATMLDYGEALRRCGQAEPALELLDRTLGLLDQAAVAEPNDATRLPTLALTQIHRGKALAELGCVDEAIAATRAAVAVFDQAPRPRDEVAAQRFALTHAEALDALATLLRELDRHDEAIVAAEQALEIVAQLARHDGVRYLHPLARLLNNLARCCQQAEQHDRAAPLFEQAVHGFAILAEAQPHAHQVVRLEVMSNHALARAQLGELDRAHAVVLELLELASAEPGWALLPLISGARQFLADLAEDLGRPDEAVEHLVAGLRLVDEAAAAGLPGASEAGDRLAANLRAVSVAHAIALPDAVAARLDR